MLYEHVRAQAAWRTCSLNPYSNGICSMSLWSQASVRNYQVLILILMEYALWGADGRADGAGGCGLNPYSNGICSMSSETTKSNIYKECLNPYSTGICSMRWAIHGFGKEHGGLNPYSTGICSMSGMVNIYLIRIDEVLILILLEYALWVPMN